MKLIRNILSAVLLMVGLNACFETPTYPIVPQIEIVNDDLYYGKSDTGDSIVVVLKFKDGDGDLGISDADNDVFKYAYKYRYLTGVGSNVVNYKFKRENPNFTIDLQDGSTPLPLSTYNFVTPYNCTNWEVIRNDNNVVTDTLFVIFNKDYYNIFIDFYTKNTDGSYTLFDPTTYFKYPNCSISGYDGRFPILSKDLGKKSPLDGKMTYALKGSAFDLLFGTKTMRLKITIQDRALHKSNEITTKDFTLASIRK
ncbi:MAG: hypothetical protein HYZ44_03925 [Bacteroidetes bacterium]|nr:hypothetical protein [Bacteroidota bacterium]